MTTARIDKRAASPSYSWSAVKYGGRSRSVGGHRLDLGDRAAIHVLGADQRHVTDRPSPSASRQDPGKRSRREAGRWSSQHSTGRGADPGRARVVRVGISEEAVDVALADGACPAATKPATASARCEPCQCGRSRRLLDEERERDREGQDDGCRESNGENRMRRRTSGLLWCCELDSDAAHASENRGSRCRLPELATKPETVHVNGAVTAAPGLLHTSARSSRLVTTSPALRPGPRSGRTPCETGRRAPRPG